MAPRAPAFHHALEGFATWLRAERNLAPRTRDAYLYDLGRFQQWLANVLADDHPAIDRITEEHLADYLTHLRDNLSYRPATTNRVVASVRVFFQWCVEEKHLEASPAERLRRPRMARKLPVYLVADELRRLFEAPDRETPLGKRDYAILVVLGYGGLRLQELVGLSMADIDFARRTLRVFGKGRKERLVPVNDTMEEALKLWLSDPDRVIAPGEKAVFVNHRGHRLTGRAVQYIVDRLVTTAGLGRDNVSPHKLRHTFATLLYSRDVDLVDIQALLGHASLTSTQIYTHTDTRRLQTAINRLPVPE